MPPPTLKNEEDRALAMELFDTLMAGWNKAYPESASDVTYGVYALLSMFEIRRRPIAKVIEFHGDITQRETTIHQPKLVPKDPKEVSDV